MHDNVRPSWAHVPSDDDVAPLSFRTDAGIRGEQEPIWTRMWHWMLGNGKTHGDAPNRPCDSTTLSQLSTKLNTAAGGKDAARIEPSRVGAAYRLALSGSAEAAEILESAFMNGADKSLGLAVDGVERSALMPDWEQNLHELIESAAPEIKNVSSFPFRSSPRHRR